VAQVAVPGRRRGFLHCRFGRQLNRQGRWWGTLMRHFLLSGPVSTLAFGMGATAPMRVLVAIAGGPYRLLACLRRASRRAVAVAPITIAADKHGGAAASAQVAASWEFHWQVKPMGDSTGTSASWNTSRATSPVWARGAASELTWRFGPVSRLRFHRPVGFLLHRRHGRYLHADFHTDQAGSSFDRFSSPALWRSLPRFARQTMDCFAIHPPQALRAPTPKPA